MHNYKINDEVYYPCDQAPFKVIGIREHEIEIEGDFSGGTHNVCQTDWVKINDVKLYDKSKVKYYSTKIPDCPFRIVERFGDNGEHSHWELIDNEGNIVWEENYEI